MSVTHLAGSTAVFSHAPLLEEIIANIQHRSDLARCLRVNTLWFEFAVKQLWDGQYFPTCANVLRWETAQDLRFLESIGTSSSSQRVKKYLHSINEVVISDARAMKNNNTLPEHELMHHLRPRRLRFLAQRNTRNDGRQDRRNEIATKLLSPLTRDLELVGLWSTNYIKQIGKKCCNLSSLNLAQVRHEQSHLRPCLLGELVEQLPHLVHLEARLERDELTEFLTKLLPKLNLSTLALETTFLSYWVEAVDILVRSGNDFPPSLHALGLELHGVYRLEGLERIFGHGLRIKELELQTGLTDVVSITVDIHTHLQPLLAVRNLTSLNMCIRLSETMEVNWTRLPDLLQAVALANSKLAWLTVEVNMDACCLNR